jgi:hypothetical protein
MAHETSFIVEYSDSEDDLYNDMFDSDCEGMSSAEELDLELGLFDDNSRQVDCFEGVLYITIYSILISNQCSYKLKRHV